MDRRYILFRQLMDLLSDEYDITSATTHNWEDNIEIKGECDGGTVTVRVGFETKEDKENGN